jgi:hypothetical protein
MEETISAILRATNMVKKETTIHPTDMTSQVLAQRPFFFFQPETNLQDHL